MKPARFAYLRPDSVDDAVEVLARSPEDTKVIAGGQSLVPLMNFRLTQPAVLVDINAVGTLAGIEWRGDTLRVGAATRTRVLEKAATVAECLPVLAHAASWVGHVQIRNRGTVGGSIAHADPTAELPAMCVLLDAEMTLVSVRGVRTVGAADFFQGFLTTAVEPDEILTEIRFRGLSADATWGFSEYAERQGDFAIAGAACVSEPSRGATRVVAFGPSDRPMRCTQAEDHLRQHGVTDASIESAGDLALAEVTDAVAVFSPQGRHRVQTVRPMVRRALTQALRRERDRP